MSAVFSWSRAPLPGSPVDGVITSVDRAATLRAALAVTREYGFTGKLCIHPAQVAAV